jgi:ABC-type transporter Mla subunit MlaD
MTEPKTIRLGLNRDEELQQLAVLAQRTDQEAKRAEDEARRLRKEMKSARKAYKRAKQSAKNAGKQARQAQADLQACLDHAIRDLAQTLQKVAATGKPGAEKTVPSLVVPNSMPVLLPGGLAPDAGPKAAVA